MVWKSCLLLRSFNRLLLLSQNTFMLLFQSVLSRKQNVLIVMVIIQYHCVWKCFFNYDSEHLSYCYSF